MTMTQQIAWKLHNHHGVEVTPDEVYEFLHHAFGGKMSEVIVQLTSLSNDDPDSMRFHALVRALELEGVE